MVSTPSAGPARLALVGDRSPAVTAHTRIPTILDELSRAVGPLDAYWLPTGSIGPDTDLSGFDAIWALPGSPYRYPDGALHAITTARTGAIPFLGTCGGFQHLLLELARQVAGLEVDHGEYPGAGPAHLLVPLTCSLLGEEDSITVVAGTRAAEILGPGTTTERYFCSYGLDGTYLRALTGAGLIVSGFDGEGALRMAELADHPFYLGCLFQPELSSDASWIHPVLTAFAVAALDHAQQRVSVVS